MHRSLLIVLAALLVVAPAVQARSCFCGASEETSEARACCCGDSVCGCSGCDRHDTQQPSRALAGCVCTESHPQWNPEQEEEPAPALALAFQDLPADDAIRAAPTAVPAEEGVAGPPTFLPLLL
ncbi:MAG: hypothetical protein ACYTEG_00970 [Planctomycetota bacterium]|jgi:hypothetical protein